MSERLPYVTLTSDRPTPTPPGKIGSDPWGAADRLESRQFDETRLFGFTFAAGSVPRYGPFEVYTAPDSIGHAEIRWAALNAVPENLFLSQCSFQFVIAEGGTQEFLPGSRDEVNGATPLDSGLRFARYQALDDLGPVKFMLRSGDVLQVFVIVSESGFPVDGQPFTIYTRVSGLIYNRGAML
jgi:hypothetical protein